MVLPYADTIEPTQQGVLFSNISKQAQTAIALPALQSSSLISLGQLCDDDCIVVLNKKNICAIKEDEVVLQDQRHFTDKIWDIPIQKTSLQEEKYVTPDLHGYTYITLALMICKQQTKKRVHKKYSFSMFSRFE